MIVRLFRASMPNESQMCNHEQFMNPTNPTHPSPDRTYKNGKRVLSDSRQF